MKEILFGSIGLQERPGESAECVLEQRYEF